jgi:carboxypeptidase Q
MLAVVAACLALLAAAPPPDVPARLVAAAQGDDQAFRRLTELCDGVGHRLSGSPALDRAIEWARAAFEKDGHENVRLEPVTVKKWVRGDELATLVTPIRQPLAMVGLGGSVGTPRGGLEAEVVVAKDEAGVRALGPAARGKILLIDAPMPPYDEEKNASGYGAVVDYRYDGPRLAAEVGAVAFLLRSLTERSLHTPHTGATRYEGAPRKVPAAAIATEDADLIHRLYDAGRRPVVRLKMGARDAGTAPSANVVAELRGRELPDEIVVIGAHLDSWDVGQGAHDDGAGVVMVIEALRHLRALGTPPRRTIRAVLWTNEENGLAGAMAYAQAHAAELPNHFTAIETDMGAFAPLGFGIEMVDEAKQAAAAERLTALMPALQPLGATRVFPGSSGADIIPLKRAGVPGMMLVVDERHYFDFHHSPADTLDKVDPAVLARGVAAMAVMAWTLAEAPGRLDR